MASRGEGPRSPESADSHARVMTQKRLLLSDSLVWGGRDPRVRRRAGVGLRLGMDVLAAATGMAGRRRVVRPAPRRARRARREGLLDWSRMSIRLGQCAG